MLGNEENDVSLRRFQQLSLFGDEIEGRDR